MRNWKRMIGGCLGMIALALAGCGGGGGSSAPATATGRFVDAPVVGMTYESGSQKGVTGEDGSFIYEVGKPVKFSIGDIVLGEAPAQAIMTPVDLAPAGADADSPEVIARVQLLMSLSSTDPDVDGKITIPPAVLAAAKGKALNFASGTIQNDLAIIVPTLVQGATLVTTDGAQNHFSGNYDMLFTPAKVAGKTIFGAGYDGYWTMNFNANGTIAGTIFPDNNNYSGTWQVTKDGKIEINRGGYMDTVTIKSADRAENFWVVEDVSANETLIDRWFHDQTAGLEQARIHYNSVRSRNGAPVFTNTLVSGKKLQMVTTGHGTIIFTFNSDGSLSFSSTDGSSGNGTWSVGADGRLTVTYDVQAGLWIKFTLVQDDATSLLVNDVHNDNSTDTHVTLTFVD